MDGIDKHRPLCGWQFEMPEDLAAIELLTIKLAEVGTLIDMLSKHTFKFDISPIQKTSGVNFSIWMKEPEQKK